MAPITKVLLILFMINHPLLHRILHALFVLLVAAPTCMSATSFSTELSLKESECDIWTGKWERDTEVPYYTNETCSTIQDHQNCMKNGRPDTEFLKWRWKPDDCELPRFDPKAFFKLVRGKTVAFIGDSLARNQMQSLMCLLSRVCKGFSFAIM